MERNFTFTHKENDYPVKVPTMGQLLEIEDKKARFARNNYSGIVQNKTHISERMLDMVDMAAHFYTLIPDLIKDLKTPNLFDLDIMDAKVLFEDYKVQFLPWMKKIESTLLTVSPTKESEVDEFEQA